MIHADCLEAEQLKIQLQCNITSKAIADITVSKASETTATADTHPVPQPLSPSRLYSIFPCSFPPTFELEVA